MTGTIYFDNNATTQPMPAVVEAMLPFLRGQYANPSSVHQFGQSIRHQIECAREKVAALIGSSPREIVLTSSGTESINLALRGALAMNSHKRHIVTTSVEHSASLRVVEVLEQEGHAVDRVCVDQDGRLDLAEWEKKLRPDTAIATLLHANNETGVLFDIDRASALAADRGILVHVDAVQSAGKLPIQVEDWSAPLVSLSAHKFHGPKGIGALYVRRRTRLTPQLVGGEQERGRRAGTENVAGIVGMGVAADIARTDEASVASYVRRLRDEFERGVLAAVPRSHVNGADAERIHNTSNISFEGLSAEAILIVLSEAGICASAGAACSSGSLAPSHVLAAMKVDPKLAHGACRFSFSRLNTAEEIRHVVASLPALLAPLQSLSHA